MCTIASNLAPPPPFDPNSGLDYLRVLCHPSLWVWDVEEWESLRPGSASTAFKLSDSNQCSAYPPGGNGFIRIVSDLWVYESLPMKQIGLFLESDYSENKSSEFNNRQQPNARLILHPQKDPGQGL